MILTSKTEGQLSAKKIKQLIEGEALSRAYRQHVYICLKREITLYTY